jgi:hypothetical protein
MLTRTGFSDDSFFAHATRQQRLTQAVIDFVRTRVIQIFALEPNLGAPKLF